MSPGPLAALVAGGFLVGSIPFGFLIGKAKGVDVRRAGSGNIGATNLGRILGRRYFVLCFVLDALKGLIPTLVAGRALSTLGGVFVGADTAASWLACAVAPILGHVFCPWLGFKGGKGVATGLGATLAVVPALTLPAAGAFAVWLACVRLWKFVSLASIVAAATLPLWTLALIALAPGAHGVFEDRLASAWPFVAVALALAALVAWTHRGNIARLRSGTERRLGERAGPT